MICSTPSDGISIVLVSSEGRPNPLLPPDPASSSSSICIM